MDIDLYSLEYMNSLIERLQEYLSGEPNNALLMTKINPERLDYDYRYSVLHYIVKYITDQKGYGNFQDIDNILFQESKTLIKANSLYYIDNLEAANVIRQVEWDTSSKITNLFRAVEMAGEAGEVMNVVKKLEREKMGIRGSRDTIEHLAEELADVVISTQLLAKAYHVDLNKAVAEKFNKTSSSNGLKTKMLLPL